MRNVHMPSLERFEAGAPADEIEISPAMLAAGAAVLADIYDDGVDWLTEDRARRVYEAMASRAPLKAATQIRKLHLPNV